jgi:hypothetical protein
VHKVVVVAVLAVSLFWVTGYLGEGTTLGEALAWFFLVILLRSQVLVMLALGMIFFVWYFVY